MADVTNLIEYTDINMEHMGFLQNGRLKLTDTYVAFKNQKTGKIESFNVDKMKACHWQRLANRYGLKLIMDDGQVHRFGGIPETDHDKLSKFSTLHWKMDLETVDLCVKGWNYGMAEFEGPVLDFKVAEKLCFEIPLSNVSNATQGKNEAVLEFHQNDECPVGLMEMRFHIPPEQETEGGDPIEEFLKNVLEYAGVVKDTDKPLATLEQILCTTPRGRYDIKVFPNHLSMHGKTFDYKIPVKSIVRLFLLTHKDGRHMFFVLGLDPPIRQGQTRYPFMVLEFNKDETIDLELGLTTEQLEQKYAGKLEKNLSGPYYEVVARIMRALVNQRVTIPGSFVGHSGTPAVSAAYKSTAGFLYPLEKGFVYVHKPAMYIRFEEVQCVYFARSDVSTRSFDFEVELKNGTIYVFNSIEKEEYTRLFDFIQKKNLRIKNAKKGSVPTYAEDAFAGSDDEERDPYKERLKQEAKEREADDDEDSEEEDSDFDPEAKKQSEDSASGSEPEEEYDSDVKNTSDEDGGDGEDSPEKPKKPKKEPKKREKSEKSSKGGKRAKKDPNAPKRAQSAYMLWFHEIRDTLKEDGMSVADVAKKGGEKWRGMNDDDKSKWTKMAEEDKKRAEKEMAEWKAAGGGSTMLPVASSKKSSSKTKSSPTKSPSKGLSKEYVSESDSSDSDNDDKPLKSKTKDKKKKEEKKPEAKNKVISTKKTALKALPQSKKTTKPKTNTKKGAQKDESDAEESSEEEEEEEESGSGSGSD